MIIAVGSLVYVRSIISARDELCVIVSRPRPEFIGDVAGHYYYEVYSFIGKEKFLAFDYEMILVGKDDLVPYFTEG